MIYSLVFNVELERPRGDFDQAVSVLVKLTCRSGKWQGTCEEPPVVTEWSDGMEQALAGIARLIMREWQPDGVAP
ncbi:MAG: hypothetical protein JNG88_06315 [Phycisphaerales bacterium]|nr:hypothetical protein [Phycisphaerales bacterium]